MGLLASGNARGMVPKLSKRPALSRELTFAAIVFLVYLGIVFLHPYFTGVSLV